MSRTGRAATAILWVLLVAVLGPAVVLTAVRLLDPGFGLALQVQAFTPFGIPLYAGVLIVLTALAALRLGAVRLLVVGAVAAVAGLALHGWWFAPLVTGDPPRAAPDAEPVTVLAANVLAGGADADGLVERVEAEDVDVLVVSEITDGFLAELEAAGLTELLPHRAGTPAADGRLEGTMAFASDAVEVVAEVRTVLDSFVLETAGVTVLATHPSPPTLPEDWHRDHQAVLTAVTEHRPDLVVGDLNATLDHPPLRELGELGYRDAVELTNGGFQPTWSMEQGSGLVGAVGLFGPVAQIDHVLVGERFTAVDAATHDLRGSDHRLVVATVAVRAGRTGRAG